MRMLTRFVSVFLVTWLLPSTIAAQEPVSWGKDLIFHTFSIAAVDPETGEVGAALGAFGAVPLAQIGGFAR